MDYKMYIGEIEKQLDLMTAQDMRAWIMQQARIAEESQRKSFLENLRGDKKYKFPLSEREIDDWCRRVEQGKLFFDAEEEEYYEEGDWEADYRMVYYDNCGIMDYLKKAMETCRRMVLAGEYKTAYRLLDRISRLKFQDNAEWGGWDSDEDGLCLERLEEEELLSIDLETLALNLLYSCYQCSENEERVEKLYDYMGWEMCRGIKMTDVFAFGSEELEGMDSFMEEWSRFLQTAPGDKAAELLADACLYLGGGECLLKTARKAVKIHPGLYRKACRMRIDAGDWEKAVEIGMEAVRVININKTIRSDIADIAARAAEKLQHQEEMKIFYEASFLSKPDSYHLLRLFRLKDKEMLRTARMRLEEVPIRVFYGSSEYGIEQQETAVTEENLKAIYRFMLGDFEYAWKKSRQDKDSLGWSYSFKADFILLLLMLLKDGESGKMKADRVFLGSLRNRLKYPHEEEDSFEEALLAWKESYFLTDVQKTDSRKWLLEEIDKRVDAVVGGGHRYSYYKAAVLIIVMGEVMEEAGEIGAVDRMIDKYMKLHSRKRAFRAEIQELRMMC